MDQENKNNNIDEKIQILLNTYPFLAYGEMAGTSYLGIIQNSDSQLISIYVLTDIPNLALRKEFLDCGTTWWWESNRQLCINIFLKERFAIFKPYLKHFSRKDFILIHGPVVSLQETIARRVRKRQVTLVRKVD